MACQHQSSCSSDISVRPRPASVVGLRLLARVWGRLADRARQRRQLARLDEDALRDIGLSVGDVKGEARKPFWRR
jgi:uncharacterized protein YjiS (DUF1127 family)